VRRKHPSDPTSEASFESHLSTVTKLGLGMLILITMASTFSSQLTLSQPKFQHRIGTPMLKSAPPGATLKEFECVAERVFPIQFTQEMRAARREFFDGCDLGLEIEAHVRNMNAKSIPHDYYDFEFKARSGQDTLESFLAGQPSMVCKPKRKPIGETLAEAQRPDSLFRKHLEGIKKERDVVVLIVRPDSFEFFWKLRDWLHKEGYQINWDPDRFPVELFHFKYYGGGGGAVIDAN
jgi:hypothetical protein